MATDLAAPQRKGCAPPPARLDLAYGAAPSQKLDVFPHADPRAATAVFVHGGYWSRHSKETFRFLVRGIHAAGLHAVFIGHTLAPDARMDRIVAEVRSAVDWTFRHLGDFCFAARPLIIVGWSSGAQLAAMTMGEPYVAGGIGISGVYDIEPMRHGSINDVLKLDKDEARRNSPALHLPASAGPFVVAHGQRELPAFRRQSEEFHTAWAAAGLAGPLLALPGITTTASLTNSMNQSGSWRRPWRILLRGRPEYQVDRGSKDAKNGSTAASNASGCSQ